MRQVVRAVALALMAASLGACAARDSGLSRSGVQVYGEMDVGVGAVRQSR